MMTTAEGTIGRVIPMRFGPGEDLLKGILAVCEKHGIKNAVMIGAIGSLKHVQVLNQMPVGVSGDQIVYGYPETPQEWGGQQGVLEMCSIQGIICHTKDGKLVPQLNCTFSNAAGTVMGGRLAEGTIVMLTSEIVIGELEGVDMCV